MTTKTLSKRDERARAAIESVIRRELADRPLESVIVTPKDNHYGEPSLYVFAVVASKKDAPSEPEQNRLVLHMIEALEEIEDLRFPYLHFGYNDVDKATQTRNSSADS